MSILDATFSAANGRLAGARNPWGLAVSPVEVFWLCCRDLQFGVRNASHLVDHKGRYWALRQIAPPAFKAVVADAVTLWSDRNALGKVHGAAWNGAINWLPIESALRSRKLLSIRQKASL